MPNNHKKKSNVKVIPVNYYRRLALIANPIILVILAILIIQHAPLEITVGVGVVAYAGWAIVLVKANAVDRKQHGKR